MRLIQGLILSVAVLAGASAQAGVIVNGSFEAGYAGWSTIGVTTIETGAFGSGPVTGAAQALLATGTIADTSSGASTAAIEGFLGLAPGALGGLGTGLVTEGSAISQVITAAAGDVLAFSWNFLTNEVTPSFFDDFAFWMLTPVSGPSVLASTASPFVLSPTIFTAQTGFGSVSIPIPVAGAYLLAFGVMDVNDSVVNSGLLVDDVHFAGVVPPRVVPEPATMALFGIGALGMGMGALRRRKMAAAAA